MNEPKPETVAAWVALVRSAKTLLDAIEAALKNAGLPPIAWYDALLEIERAGSAGLRPFELQDRLLLPQYGTSRLLDRVAKAGLIEKLDCTGDGRGRVVRITEEGQRIRRAAWPVYREVLRTRLEGRLDPEELETLARLLRRIGADPGADGTAPPGAAPGAR